MKKIIILLMLIPIPSFAETWVCSYIHYERIETHNYKRVSDNEFIDTKSGQTFRIYNEDKNQITLTHTHGDLGLQVIFMEKKGKHRFNSTWTLFESVDSWKGNCEIVK